MKRTCCKCKVSKSLSDFYRDKGKKLGRKYICKRCSGITDKEPQRKRRIRREEKIQQSVFEYKQKRGCFMCEESDPLVLDLHHKDPSNKKSDISQMISNGCSLSDIMMEAEKCEVVCANDHRRLHYAAKIKCYPIKLAQGSTG